MAEQPSPSVSTTGCEDVVKIPKTQYKFAVEKLKQQQLQLVAASNLQRLVQEKDEQLMAAKEKNKHLKLSLQHSEARFSNIIRLQSLTAATNWQGPTHALEEDGANVIVQPLPSDVVPDGEAGTQSRLPYGYTTDCSNKSVTLDSNAPTLSVTSSATESSISTKAYPTVVTCSSSTIQMTPLTSITSAAYPESKDLLDKVLQQNARLKKTLRDLLSQKGLSVSTYLDKQEYEDAAEILRHDLTDAQKHVSQLKSIIASRDNGDIDRLSQQCSHLAAKVALLERKLAISQAYSDALKQTHEKSRQGDSHVETSTESTSAASSADYAQLLEELQTVKGHRDDLETTNKTLQTQSEAFQLQLEAKDAELSEQKRVNQQLLDEQQLNKTQIAAYEEDFKIEQKEKQELQAKYEINIAKHQEWIRRLAEEAQKCRQSWQEETKKRQQLENKFSSIPSGYRPTSPSEGIGSKCSSLLSSSLPRVVGQDGPADASVGNDSDKRQMDILICPRCEREFPCTEQSRWEIHCRRCTDN